MSDEVQEFFALKQRYQSANSLVQSFLLDEKFEQLALSASSPALRKSIRAFIDSEKSERARRHKEIREKHRIAREDHVAERMEVMERWRQGIVQRSTARGLIEASAWWLTHSSGEPVRAPRHSERVENLNGGWSIEFGANHFLVSKLVQNSAPWFIEGFDLIRQGELLNKKFYVQKVKSAAPGCVANYNYDRYERYEPSGGRLVFGAQALDIGDAANYLVNTAGISRYCL
jgi:hypothetical protein